MIAHRLKDERLLGRAISGEDVVCGNASVHDMFFTELPPEFVRKMLPAYKLCTKCWLKLVN